MLGIELQGVKIGKPDPHGNAGGESGASGLGPRNSELFNTPIHPTHFPTSADHGLISER